jgi:hypothetical protein
MQVPLAGGVCMVVRALGVLSRKGVMCFLLQGPGDAVQTRSGGLGTLPPGLQGVLAHLLHRISTPTATRLGRLAEMHPIT